MKNIINLYLDLREDMDFVYFFLNIVSMIQETAWRKNITIKNIAKYIPLNLLENEEEYYLSFKTEVLRDKAFDEMITKDNYDQ